MKILEVSGYYPPSLGGQQNAVQAFARRLAARGHAVTVLTSDRGGRQGRETQRPNLQVRHLRAWEAAHTPLIPTLLGHLLRAPRDAVIHVHYGQPLIPEIVGLAAALRHLPYVAHIHIDPRPSGPLGFLLPLYKRLLFRVFLRRARAVITLNRAQAERLRQHHRCRRGIRIVANGVAAQWFQERPPPHPGPPVVLFVGRLSRQKNLPRLVEALRRVRSRCFAVIVGAGEMEGTLAQMIRTHRLHNIHLAGARRGEALRRAYRAADIFVLPSDNEGAPLALLEAMAAGLPVVASALPELRELVADGGLLVDPPDATGFAAAIERLVENPALRADLGARGRERVRRMEWETAVSQVEAILREAAAPRSPSRRPPDP